jgi:hypothetical protein
VVELNAMPHKLATLRAQLARCTSRTLKAGYID